VLVETRTNACCELTTHTVLFTDRIHVSLTKFSLDVLMMMKLMRHDYPFAFFEYPCYGKFAKCSASPHDIMVDRISFLCMMCCSNLKNGKNKRHKR
jgi:hypothetical protein